METGNEIWQIIRWCETKRKNISKHSTILLNSEWEWTKLNDQMWMWMWMWVFDPAKEWIWQNTVRTVRVFHLIINAINKYTYVYVYILESI